MDLTQLEGFLAVVRLGSFSRAAAALGLTQPGVSRQVLKLERELGTPLLLRERGNLRPTPAGERFRAFADGVLDGYHRVRSELGDLPARVEGALRIAASTTPGEFLVPGLLDSFTRQHPRVRPEVFIGDSTEVVQAVLSGLWDLGFVGARLTEEGLRYRAVAEDEIVLAVPATHPFARRTEIRLAELANQAFIEREGGSGTLLTVRALLAERQLALPSYRVVMVLGNTQAVVSAVESGYGLGWVSARALEHRDPRRVATVRLQEPRLIRPLYVIHPRARPLPPVTRTFLSSLRAPDSQP